MATPSWRQRLAGWGLARAIGLLTWRARRFATDETRPRPGVAPTIRGFIQVNILPRQHGS